MNKYFGLDYREKPTYSMTQGFTIDMLADMAPEYFNEKLLYALNKELIRIKNRRNR